MSAITLRDYQAEALNAIRAAIARGIMRPLLALPTGTGKTVVFGEDIRQVVEAGGRALVLTHRVELIDQARQTLARLEPSLRIGVVKGERDEYDAPVVIASVQTAWRPSRLASLGTEFQRVVVDEAHHATAPTWRTILDSLRNVPVLGVTATPYRGDGTPLGGVFDEVVYAKTIGEMIPTWLCDLRCERIRVQADFNRLHTVGGDLNKGEAGTMLLDADAPAEIVAAYKQHAMGRRALCFTPTIAVAEAVAEKFREAGVPSEALSDNVSDDERHQILARLRRGDTLVVPNCTILTEGFDCPDVSCIIIARPTRSKQLYVQMVGRGTRRAAGKENCIVLDTVGASERHDLQDLGSIFGVTMRPGESYIEARERELVEREAAALAAAERGRIVSTRVQLLREQALHWAVAPEGDLSVLSFGKQGSVRLVLGESGLWTVIRQYGADQGYAHQAWDTELELADATALAESMASDLNVRSFVDRDAGWRRGPVQFGSPQCVQANKLKLRYTTRTTKGQLSDMLSIAYARRSEDYRTGKKRRREVPFWVRRSS